MRRVGDLAVGDRNVEVTAHQHAFAADVADIVQCLEAGHAGPFRVNRRDLTRTTADARLRGWWQRNFSLRRLWRWRTMNLRSVRTNNSKSALGRYLFRRPVPRPRPLAPRLICVSLRLAPVAARRDTIADLAGAQETGTRATGAVGSRRRDPPDDPALVVDIAHDQLYRAEQPPSAYSAWPPSRAVTRAPTVSLRSASVRPGA